MGTRKAFVFSLDSFVAFVLTVAALYSLLFFATVPSAYYSSLMQADYLAKDTLLALATTVVGENDLICDEGQTYLACVIEDDVAARNYIGSDIALGEYHRSALVPSQFGYKLEVMEYDELEGGEIDYYDGEWAEVYNTATDSDSANKKQYHKLKAAAHALYIGYDSPPEGADSSPLKYMTCSGDYTICEWPEPFVYYPEYDHPSNWAIIGDADAYVVRLTVYT